MPTNRDHNLLLGMLALHLNFINRDQFVAAAHAWVLNKDRALDEILVEMDALQPENQSLLNSLVAKHIEMHKGDVEESLAAVRSLDSDTDLLAQLGDNDLAATSAPNANRTPSPGDKHDEPDPLSDAKEQNRYQLICPYASGGLGEVFLARDNQLNRTVALKRIKPKYVADKNSQLRFSLEAEITARLEHPGVIPIYSQGTNGEGEPYYTMRFVRGDDLKKAADRLDRSQLRSGREHIYRRGMSDLRQLLIHFLAACQAVDYAHSKGVIHRDIKPSNIMLGKHGETLVVDWGLAKILDLPEEESVELEATLPQVSGTEHDLTRHGSALGTPGYMSPEQATGRLDEIGPGADIYSLGATLYYLLTGKSPFHDTGRESLQANILAGEPTNPRQLEPWISPDLESIVLRAMSNLPKQRFESAKAFFKSLEDWLVQQPLESEHRAAIRKASHIWGILLAVGGLFAIFTAFTISPWAWAGVVSETHSLVWAAVLLGGLIVSLPVALAFSLPERAETRHCVAVGAMLLSGLLVHLTGGRIETHFSAFFVLAALAFYGDWKVLLTAAGIKMLDLWLRGIFWPLSVFGVNSFSPYRWLEHSAYNLAMVVTLVIFMRSMRYKSTRGIQPTEFAGSDFN